MRVLPNPSPRLLVNVISQLLYEWFFRLVLHSFQCVKTSYLPTILIQLMYKYICSCGSDYIGRTSNQLDLRIKQHLPARILNLELRRGQLVNTSGSSIAEHMINCRECVADFNVDRFSILSWSHSIFHLKVLETLYVRSLQPSLCKQRNCLLGLNVIGLWPFVHHSYSPPSVFFFFLIFYFTLLLSFTFFLYIPPFKFF